MSRFRSYVLSKVERVQIWRYYSSILLFYGLTQERAWECGQEHFHRSIHLDDAHPIARTPTPVAVEEVRASQEEEEEPVREPTPKPATPEPVQEVARSRNSSVSVSTASSVRLKYAKIGYVRRPRVKVLRVKISWNASIIIVAILRSIIVGSYISSRYSSLLYGLI